MNTRRCNAVAGVMMVILAVSAGASGGEEFAVKAMKQLTMSQRRLFGGIQWPDNLPDPNDVVNDAGDLITDTGNQIGDHATTSFDFVKKNFEEASKVLDAGHQVINAASDATSKFSSHMTAIYNDFKPLEPVFAAQHGLITLLTNEERLERLTKVLLDLVRSTDQVSEIGHVVGSVAEVFGDLNGMFNRELEKLAPAEGRRLRNQSLSMPVKGRRLQDYTALLDGLNFDQVVNSMNDFATQAQSFNTTLYGIRGTLEPVLESLESHLEGRRLIMDQEQIEQDHDKYAGAVRQIIPSWQRVEGLVKDACTQTDVALETVSNLECRIKGFAGHATIPGLDSIPGLVGDCDTEAAKQSNLDQCPVASHSEGIRDSLSDNAGLIGWVALSFEYTVKNHVAVRITFATVLLIVGIMVGFCGYRWKEVHFLFEGFLAGLVVWTTVIAILVCWFGVCREGFIHTCEPSWVIAVVLVLSLGCAFGSMMTQRFQMFLSGFDLGATLAGVIYMIIYRCEVFDAFLDAEAARGIITWLLVWTIVTGLVCGALTVLFSKPAIVGATSAMGAALIIFAVYMYFDHELGWGDVIAFAFVTTMAIAVQYLVTSKGVKDEYGKLGGSDDGDDEAKTSG